ncbi:hypothetical protein KEM48_003255 [Puccinia striiformis f. sp. tritici PST-130]|nr:hypothetical protein KEM48_003255 [Puccinia striiformis f. sp. tritici PST-130]
MDGLQLGIDKPVAIHLDGDAIGILPGQHKNSLDANNPGNLLDTHVLNQETLIPNLPQAGYVGASPIPASICRMTRLHKYTVAMPLKAITLRRDVVTSRKRLLAQQPLHLLDRRRPLRAGGRQQVDNESTWSFGYPEPLAGSHNESAEDSPLAAGQCRATREALPGEKATGASG